MRIFVAGATGVIGLRIVRLLTQAGHEVAAMTRSASKSALLRGLGAQDVVCDVFDSDLLMEHCVAFRPDVVVHQLTDLPDEEFRIPECAEANNRMRREGTRALLAAAVTAGSSGLVAQSVAWELPPNGAAAVEDLERQVLEVSGIVARYGRFYGPGTYSPASAPASPRIHVDDAAERTIPLIEGARAGSGIVLVAESAT